MRTIKFRGRVIESEYWHPTDDDVKVGDLVYGDLRHCGVHTLIFKQEQCYEAELLIEVDPESVAQLVGYDKDGKEVYEGDIVFEEYLSGETCEHVARLESMTQVPDTCGYYFWTYPTHCKLKEARK